MSPHVEDDDRAVVAVGVSPQFPYVVGALLSVALVYGAWSLIAKATLVASGIAPLVLATYRCVGGAAVMLTVQRLAAEPRVDKNGQPRAGLLDADFRSFALLGLLMAANIGGNILALAELSALTVSIFQPMLPVFAGAFAAALGVEELSLPKAIGITCSAGGAIMVVALGEHVRGGASGPGEGSLHRGVAFLLVNVSGGALYCVLQKGMLRLDSPMLVAGLAQLIAGGILFLAAAATVGLSAKAWDLRGNHMALAALCYCTLLTTAYNYSVLAWANRETTPTTVTGFSTMQPVFASLLSWLVLGVGLTGWQALGGLVIIVGLLIFSRAHVKGADHGKLVDKTEL